MAQQCEFPPIIAKDAENFDLLTACADGNLKVLEALVQSGRELQGVKDDEDNTCLGLAVFNGHLNVVKFLVEHGCSAAEGDKYGTVLMTACGDTGNLAIVKFLVENGADVNAKNDVGNTCLGLAQSFKRGNVVEYLLEVLKSKASNET
jgi:ankyrin repeat protein